MLYKIIFASVLLSTLSACSTKIVPMSSATKTQTFKVLGNCGMCEKTIEAAVQKNKVASGEWDKNTKMLTLIYDSVKTSPDEVLKRVALVGYDSEKFRAPDDAYTQLPECCQYSRAKQVAPQSEVAAAPAPVETSVLTRSTEPKVVTQPEVAVVQTPPTPPMTSEPKAPAPVQISVKTPVRTAQPKPVVAEKPFKTVFDSYFALKDGLVKTDGKTASAQAKKLLTALNAVKMEALTPQEHTVFMKTKKDLTFDAGHIEETKDAAHQRDHFDTLSKNMYALMKVSKQETPTYYQHCPMANEGKGALR